MKLANQAAVPVYTVSGSSTARPLPEWLARKRKRSLKNDPEYASRIELLQDFEFEEASQCIRVSEDGNWVMSTGTYKPQIHAHNLQQLSLSFSRHTNTLNTTFELLSTDYTKSIHLQEDRTLEFHTAQGCHYTVRIPRYGRDLKYAKNTTEALIPSVGLNQDGNGEVFRLHLEYGKFLRSYEVDLSEHEKLDELATAQFRHESGVNVAAVAEASHNLLAFGTASGTVEFWDPRARNRIGALRAFARSEYLDEIQETTALEFHESGLSIACGSSGGLIHLYDLRSPIPPLLKKTHDLATPIKTLIHLTPSSRSRIQTDGARILSADKRSIRIWDSRTGTPWTSVEPNVDLNSVAWCRDSGMLLTANEGRQQHIFFVPQLGPAPKWCSFLDNLVEEMAEDSNDPGAFANQSKGDIYENYKFLTTPQLETLNLSHLIGTTSLMRPYMHGYFVAQNLYEEARLISDPFVFDEQRARKVKERVEKERESRIRGSKKIPGLTNRALAEKLVEKERKVSKRSGVDEANPIEESTGGEVAAPKTTTPHSSLLTDARFSKLFTNSSFTIDETSREYQQLNPSTEVPADTVRPREKISLTAVEKEQIQQLSESSSENSEDDDAKNAPNVRASVDRMKTKSSGNRKRAPAPAMNVRDSSRGRTAQDRSFASRSAHHKEKTRASYGGAGEREVTFLPRNEEKKRPAGGSTLGPKGSRRSASGNVFRRL